MPITLSQRLDHCILKTEYYQQAVEPGILVSGLLVHGSSNSWHCHICGKVTEQVDVPTVPVTANVQFRWLYQNLLLP